MRMVLFLEERSMKYLLDIILPKILPPGVEFLTIPHEGKSDLEKSLEVKMRGWNNPEDIFVIVHDQDSNDCHKLKSDLREICVKNGRNALIRIACHELEAWYFGDLKAVELAYGKHVSRLSSKAKYRIPDDIVNPKNEFMKLFPDHKQITGAKAIGPYMDIERNTSKSFQVFVAGILRIVQR